MIHPHPVWQSPICLSPLRAELAAASGFGASDPPEDEEADRSQAPGAGMHMLLVEDQTIIALDTESMLRELGARNVDAFTTAAAALEWLQSAKPDVAVLDVNLGTTDSFAVADALRARAIPLLFTTGYGDSTMIPKEFGDVPVVRKPYTLESLSAALERCLTRRAS